MPTPRSPRDRTKPLRVLLVAFRYLPFVGGVEFHVHQVARRLAAAGVDIEMGPLMLSGARGDGTSIYVRDPDGNRVELRYYD